MHVLYLTSVLLDESTAPAVHVKNTCKSMNLIGEKVSIIHPVTPLKGPISFDWAEYQKQVLYPQLRGGWRLYERLLPNVIRAAYKRWTPDLIYLRHTPSNFLTSVLKELEAPKVLEVNGFYDFSKPRLQKLVQQVDLVLLDNIAMEAYFREKVPDQSHKARTHLSHATDTSKIYPLHKTKCRQELNINRDKKVLLHVSGFQPHHDFKTQREAIGRLLNKRNDLLLILVGDGPTWSEHHSHFKDLIESGHVLMPGRVPRGYINQYISSADICLDTLTSECLKMGNLRALKIYEYLACERPVITTVRNDLPIEPWAADLMHLIPPESPIILADAIENILNSPQEWEEKAKRGREYVCENRSWRAATLTTLTCLDELLSGE